MKSRIFILLFSALTPLFSFSQNSPVSLTDTTSGCIPFNVTFQNPNPNAISFSWDFGDGNQSILENPSNTYIQDGLKTIQLILGFNNAPNDTIVLTDYIEVIVSPTANFNLNNLGTSCENQNIYEFENLSTNSTSSFWDFGDGSTSSSLNPTHTYSSSGNYPVTLVANNGNCVSTTTYSSIIIEENPSVTANSSSLFSCDSTNQYNFTAASSTNQPNLSWQWNFGDGNSSSSINTSHIYNASGTFDPFVVATNASTCSDTFFLNTIENWISPVSTISAQNYSGCEPFSTQFSIQSNGTISTVDWDFGVGSIINSIFDTISYTYSSNGIHNVSTLVTFSNGCNVQVDLVQPITINPAPTATYSFSDSSGCAPLTVQFQSSTNQGNTVVWNFGDGDSSLVSQGSPSHIYLTNGLFFPQLTVTDPIGCSSTYTLDTINSGGFVADFSCSVQTGCTPLTVDFTPTSSGASSWFWDFGDGNTSNLAHPNHVYTNSGIFDVGLTITNASGCIDTIHYSSLIESYTETINLPQSDSIFTCSPFTFNPNVQNLALTNYQWDFGDGTTASGTNPSHEYQNSGLYTVELAATTPNGCLAQIDEFAVVTVNGLEINLDVSLSSCDSSIFSAINNSTGNVSNQWIVGEDTLLSASISQQLNQSTLIQYTSTSSIGCEVSQYIPILLNCDSTTNDTIVFTPPMDTLPINPNNPGGIITYPVVNFTCGPELVNLTSPFSNASSYFWDFGDGFTSAQQNPSHLYNSSGSFHLTHHALMPNGNTQILIIDYFINQHAPQVDFNYTENLLCDSAEVTFSSTAQSATSWNWNFGNGNSLNSPNAVFSFPIDNFSKVVSLTIVDTNSCSATKTKILTYFEPIVEVQQDTIICFGDTLEINAQSGTMFSYNWNMDDGNTYSNQIIQHEYVNPGIYNISLELTDANSCTRNIPLLPINVFKPISTFNPTTNQSICVGESITFTSNNTTTNNYSNVWVIDGNYRNNLQTDFQFNSTGTYSVSHRIFEKGCFSETIQNNLITVLEAEVDFSYTQLNACLPVTVNFTDLSTNAVSWNWNFGDGNFSSAQNPHHSFSLVSNNDITLSIVDANGCSGSHTKSNISTFNNDFSVSEDVVCVNSFLNFTSSTPLAANWLWDFGDGNTSNLANPAHQYSSAGIYDVKLIVDDGQGCYDTLFKEQLIEVKEVIAQFTHNSPSNCPPIISQFNNLSTGATQYLWNFGDGSSSIMQTPSHVYTAAGNYVITLIASNNIGCSDTLVSSNPIIVPGPIIDFSINNSIDCDSLNIQITNNTSSASSYLWNFGNGDTSTVTNPNYTYSSTGSYSVTLTAYDNQGCVSYFQYPIPVEVIATPNANFSLGTQHFCIPSSLTITNNSTIASSFNWSYGNQSSSVQNPTFNVFHIGSQPIQLVASNQMCSDTSSFNVIGHFNPSISIIDPGLLCENEGVIQLQTSNSFNSTISWYINGTSSNGFFDPRDFTGSTISVVAVSNGYCPSTDTITIPVLQVPDATILSSNISLCEGEPGPSLLAQQQGGIWNGINVNPLTGSINTSGMGQGNYTITYTINGQCSNSDSIQLSILNQPNVAIADPGLICSNIPSVNLSANYPNGIWAGNSIHSSSGEILVSDLNIGYHNYIYSIEGDCPSSDTLEIEITEFLEATVLQPAPICESNQLLFLHALNPGGIWNGIGIENMSVGNFKTNALSAGIYTVTYQTSGLCNDTDSTYVIINPNPELDFEFKNPTHCIGSTIEVLNNSNNINEESFQWFIDDSLFSHSPNPSFILELGGYNFSVEVINQYGCKTRSNLSESLIVYDTTPLPAPEIIRSTVINDQDVYTEWAPKQNAVNEVKEYVLFKSVDQTSYEYLGTFDISIDNYIDPDVDVFSENYTYYVVSINKCNVPSNASNISSSVLLGYEKPNEFQTILRWSSYENWSKGVNRYEIQKLNEYGQWEVLKVVNPDVNNTLIDP